MLTHALWPRRMPRLEFDPPHPYRSAMRNACLSAAILALALVGCESSDAPARPEPVEYRLVFEDDFQSPAIDSGKWTVAAGAGCPALCATAAQATRYAAANVVVRDGALLVQAQRGLGGAAFSGAVHTLGKFSFRHGRVEIEARLPAAADVLAAIRLLPVEGERYGPWPSSGEIAVVESFAEARGAVVRSATRYGLPTPPFHGASARYDVGPAADMRMAKYALEWDADEMRFFLDGDHVHTQTADEWYTYFPAGADGEYDDLGAYRVGTGSAPFDQPFYLAIDLAALGGSERALPQSLEVDAVRVYECVNDVSGRGCGERSEAATTLADNDGGPLQDAETAKPFVEQLVLYANGPAALAVPVDGAAVETTLLPESTGDPWTTVMSNPRQPEAGNPGNIVWRFAVFADANASGRALLSLPNRSESAFRESGFDFSGSRTEGPGADPVGEVVFDMYAETLAETATISVGLADGYPSGRTVQLPNDDIPRGAWKTVSVKFADLLSVSDAEGGCCGLGLANVARPFMLHVQGGDADLLLDNIRVVNACKVVGGCGANTAEIVSPRRTCTAGERLRFGFYAFFAPVSYSADEDPDSAGFAMHRGFEAALLSALEALDDAGLSFSRHPITTWPNIWLRSTSEYDVVGGGITILDSRTRNSDGETVVRFTRPHIAFEQSLLVRSEDATQLATHAMLASDVRVGVLAGTTGEARLLQLTGLTDAEGNLAAGTQVETPAGTIVADGSSRFRITSAGTTENLVGRTRLLPPDASGPQVIYLGQELGERELLQALEEGAIDAVARGTIGNSDAAVASNGKFTVTARDPNPEYGGWTVAADRTELRSCLNAKIRWLTDDGRIGYPEWRADQGVFMRRAETWNAD